MNTETEKREREKEREAEKEKERHREAELQGYRWQKENVCKMCERLQRCRDEH